MIFYPAMLKMFDECPQKYKFVYKDKISLPKNDKFFEKGKNIHALANYKLKGLSISKIEEILSPAEKELWQHLKNTTYFEYEVIGSEHQVISRLNDYWIGGRLDALVKNGEDYFILDYKTGSAPKNPTYEYQTMVYLLCVDQILKKYNSLQFVYIDLKNKSEAKVEFTKELKNEYIEKLSKAIQALELSDLSPKESLRNIKCKCDYYCICSNSMLYL